MALIRTNSLENYLLLRMMVLCCTILAVVGFYTWQINLKWQWIVVIEIVTFFICLLFIISTKQRVMRAFTRASLHLDAITQEDFNQFGKSAFESGKVKDFHLQLKKLSEQLQKQKSHYDQQAFLVYQLISQLDTPILVFNKKQKLTFGNDAFHALFKQPWQMFRHASPELLGLTYTKSAWEFTDQAKQSRWQIRHSQFIDDGEHHQLLVFIDIEPALRESQLNAWQQIIRVLGHEIRNSLTPVSSMAETLADKAENERDKRVLAVITERCLHLQSFVNRYASLSQQLQIHCQWLSVEHVVKSLDGLFSKLTLHSEQHIDSIWADAEFLEQVLINLLKNAVEANATEVSLNFAVQEQYHVIEIADNGHGFSNMNNLFVPLYSTKPQGQGIGLSFCRNIIEHHHGILELHNNESDGVTVMIILPIPNEISYK